MPMTEMPEHEEDEEHLEEEEFLEDEEEEPPKSAADDDEDLDSLREPRKDGRRGKYNQDKVQKRIDRLTRVAREAEERAERFEKMYAEVKKQHRDSEESSYNDQMKDLESRKAKAVDEGDMEEYDKVATQIMDLRLKQTSRPAEPKTPPPPSEPTYSEAAQDWLDNNSNWFQKDKKRTQFAIAEEKKLMSEGYEVTDPDTYEELDRRIEKRFGETEDKDTSVPRSTRRQPRRKRSNGEGRITKENLETMRKYGMDPNDPKQRAGFMAHRSGTKEL